VCITANNLAGPVRFDPHCAGGWGRPHPRRISLGQSDVERLNDVNILIDEVHNSQGRAAWLRGRPPLQVLSMIETQSASRHANRFFTRNYCRVFIGLVIVAAGWLIGTSRLRLSRHNLQSLARTVFTLTALTAVCDARCVGILPQHLPRRMSYHPGGLTKRSRSWEPRERRSSADGNGRSRTRYGAVMAEYVTHFDASFMGYRHARSDRPDSHAYGVAYARRDGDRR
jgi:hypothetical protein